MVLYIYESSNMGSDPDCNKSAQLSERLMPLGIIWDELTAPLKLLDVIQ